MGKIGIILVQWGPVALVFVGGWFGFSYINQASAQTAGGLLWAVGVILTTMAAVIIGMAFNILLHESGHLMGGSITGYSFLSFGVLNMTIVKENGKLVRKNYRIPGTGGACSLSPPDMKNGKYPYMLFISSGLLANFLVSCIFLGLFYHFAGTSDFWARVFLVFGVVGVYCGVANIIPHKYISPSDGYLLFNLGRAKNAEMRRGLWSCLRVQGLVASGTRPRDIPVEMFDWVDIDNIGDPFTMETAKKRYEYLLDRQEYDEAGKLVKTLCDNQQETPEVIKMPLYCELLFHELIGECRQEEIDRLYDKNLKEFIKGAHLEVVVQRLMYAYACLVLKDAAKAEEHLELFHKACDMSIQSGAVPGEQELIALIDRQK